jgi:peptide/nickel transport system substrate-binding protein/oligopeptide transport system substrate-binding protein
MGMLFSKLRKFYFCFFIFIFVTLGCQKKESNHEDLFLRIRLENDPTTLDPAYIVDVTGGNIGAKIFNGLVKYDENMQVVGDIAEHYDVSDDGLEYTFKLRHGLRFHCGRVCSSEDVRYSFERILDEETASPRARVLQKIKGANKWEGKRSGHIEGVVVSHPDKLKIILEEPTASFLSLLTMPTAYIVCKKCVQEKGSHSGYCGTGPYFFKEWKHDRFIALGVNKNYFGKKPKGFDGLIYYIIPEDFTAAAELSKARIEVMEIPTSLLSNIKEKEGPVYYISEGLTLSTYYLGINCRKSYFADAPVRQAIAMAIDREKIIKHLMEETVIKADGPIPPVLMKHRQKGISFMPEKAKEILSQKEIRDVRLKLFAKSTKQNTDIVSAIAFDLEKAGLKIDIELRDWSTLKETVNKGEADLFFLSWWADIPDGIDFLFPTFHSSNHGAAGNRSFFNDPHINMLIEKAQKTTDEIQRQNLYSDIAQMIVEKSPWVFLWHKKSYYAVSKRLSGFKVYPMYNMDKGENYKIKK